MWIVVVIEGSGKENMSSLGWELGDGILPISTTSQGNRTCSCVLSVDWL